MKRGLFLVATVTLSSALYAQQTLTRQAVTDVFTQYNPQLMAAQQERPQIKQLVDQVIDSYAKKQLPDTLENRYTLIALVRNFENSILLDALTRRYERALLYAQVGNEQAGVSAQEFAQQTLPQVYARMWAVSVQVKEDLLKQYQQKKNTVSTDVQLTAAQQQQLNNRYRRAISLLKQDLRQLHSAPGEQIQLLTQQTLLAAQQKVKTSILELQTQQTPNLQIKTKHKKPVAE